jgi:hypothetical protein
VYTCVCVCLCALRVYGCDTVGGGADSADLLTAEAERQAARGAEIEAMVTLCDRRANEVLAPRLARVRAKHAALARKAELYLQIRTH